MQSPVITEKNDWGHIVKETYASAADYNEILRMKNILRAVADKHGYKVSFYHDREVFAGTEGEVTASQFNTCVNVIRGESVENSAAALFTPANETTYNNINTCLDFILG